MLLPNSASEYTRLFRAFGVEQRYRVIPNAIDPRVFSPPTPPGPREKGLVLCVGRIEGLKNQRTLIRALNGTEFKVMIIGSASANHMGYYEACRAAAAPNISFAGPMSQQELAALYSRAQVHVLPSWFETTGLSTMEAAAMGCAIVITDKGDQREYFGDQAFYCDPAEPATILQAVRQAAAAPPDGKLQQKIHLEYTWERAAELTASAYANLQLIKP
jgi:glycosyltransferase involved in cell wall biosynthesis